MSENTIDAAFLGDGTQGLSSEPAYSGALSFLRRSYSRDLKDVDVAVTGVPLDIATSNRPGARFGPRAVREASSIIDWERPYNCPVNPLEELRIVDYGDCTWDYGEPDTIVAAIEKHITTIIEQDVTPLVLGGDHFLTFPVLQAMAKKYPDLCLLHFDAHSDTWDDEGGDGRLDHGTMFYHAAKQGLINPKNSLQVGLRTYNPDTFDFNILDAPWVHANGPDAVIKKIRTHLGDRPFYLTFDIDCLDPAYAPGTGTPVCGGLTTATALHIIRGLHGLNIVGMDVVEVAPAYDIGQVTALAAATIAYDYLGLVASRAFPA